MSSECEKLTLELQDKSALIVRLEDKNHNLAGGEVRKKFSVWPKSSRSKPGFKSVSDRIAQEQGFLESTAPRRDDRHAEY